MPTHLETVAQLRAIAMSGELGKATTADLEVYAAALCHPNAFGEFGAIQFPQICETVRVHLLRAHIAKLQGHITDLDAKNTALQKWVAALAAIAIVVGLVQAIAAILPYAGIYPPPPPVSAPPAPTTLSVSPTLPANPSSDQAIKK